LSRVLVSSVANPQTMIGTVVVAVETDLFVAALRIRNTASIPTATRITEAAGHILVVVVNGGLISSFIDSTLSGQLVHDHARVSIQLRPSAH